MGRPGGLLPNTEKLLPGAVDEDGAELAYTSVRLPLTAPVLGHLLLELGENLGVEPRVDVLQFLLGVHLVLRCWHFNRIDVPGRA